MTGTKIAFLPALLCLLHATCGPALASQGDVDDRLHAAGVLEERGDYAGAEKILTTQRDAANLGPDDPRKGIIFHKLGSVYHSQGRYLEAETHYKAAIEFWKRTAGLGDVPLIQSTRNLAALYLETDQHAKAERLGLHQLASRLEATMPDSSAFAGLTGTLGALAFAQGRFVESEGYYQRTLALWEKLAPNSRERMEILIDVGLLCYRTARYAEARRYYEHALGIAQVLGRGHPEEVKLLANIGAVEFKAHGPAEAKPFYQRAIETGERALGRDHPVVAQVLLEYAAVLRSAKQKAQAKVCQQRAEAILKAVANRDARNYSIDISDLQRRPTLR